jgi:Domain of unknown function (DUF4259)
VDLGIGYLPATNLLGATMGAWGKGIFENDTACDLAADVADGGGISTVEHALDRILLRGVDYLEAHDAEEGLAAAEIVARLNGSPGDKTPYTARVDRWIEGCQTSVVGPEMIEKARRATLRVFDGWKRSLEALLDRLGPGALADGG